MLALGATQSMVPMLTTGINANIFPATPEPCLDDIESLFSLSAPLKSDGGMESFTSLLSETPVSMATLTNVCLGNDVPSETGSEIDSGYRTSPPVTTDESSLESWLVNSASSGQMAQLLPPINSIISGCQMITHSSSFLGDQFKQLTNNISQEEMNIMDLLNAESPVTSPTAVLTPPPTPALYNVEPMNIKQEPLDILDEVINEQDNNTATSSDSDMPPLISNDVLNMSANSNTAAMFDAAAANMLSQIQPTTSQPPMVMDMKSEEMATPSPNPTSAEDLFRLKFSPHVLPPCRVCGAQATGYHYGANTCEPCKGFYHRMMKRADKNLVCLKQNNCVITAKNRGACPSCRFQKCIKAGMAKNNIKTGRYSYSKRSRDIIELQQSISEQQQKQQEEQAAQQRVFDFAFTQQVQSAAIFAHHDISPPLLSRSPQQPEVMSPVENEVSLTNIVTSLKVARDKLMTRLKTAKYELSPEQTAAIQNFSQQIDSGKYSYAYAAFLQWVNIGFKHNFWSSYIKAIPGFKKLHMQDQITIIKKCFIDFWVVARHRLFDVESGMYYAMGGLVIPFNQIFDENECSCLMKAVKRLQSLRLSVEESCVLSAFVILNTDSSDMNDSAAVEALRMRLLDTLMFLLKKNRDRPYAVYAHIISALTELKGAIHTIPQHMAHLPQNVTPALFKEILLSLDS